MKNFFFTKLKTGRRWALMYLLMAVLLLLVLYFNLFSGTVSVTPADFLRLVLLQDQGSMEASILWNLRLPRALMTVILGGALALSGFLLQTYFANPIAGPFILGISSGAKLAVTICLILLLNVSGSVSSFVLIVAAFAGALFSTVWILYLSGRVKNMSSILIGGIMIGYVCSAATDLMITFASDADIVNLRNWSQGSFSGMSWDNVQVAFPVVGVASVLTFFHSREISAFQLGEGYARSVGVPVVRFRRILILLSSILSATVTAYAGPVSFVGVAAPYLIKHLFHTSRPEIIIPACFMGGAVFTGGADLLARMLLRPTELNISTVTSILGAPIVIMMLMRERKHR